MFQDNHHFYQPTVQYSLFLMYVGEQCHDCHMWTLDFVNSEITKSSGGHLNYVYLDAYPSRGCTWPPLKSSQMLLKGSSNFPPANWRCLSKASGRLLKCNLSCFRRPPWCNRKAQSKRSTLWPYTCRLSTHGCSKFPPPISPLDTILQVPKCSTFTKRIHQRVLQVVADFTDELQ